MVISAFGEHYYMDFNSDLEFAAIVKIKDRLDANLKYLRPECLSKHFIESFLCECFHTYLYVNPFEVVTKKTALHGKKGGI